MNLKSYLDDRRKLVESSLLSSLEDEFIPNTLKDAMQYSLKAGGKRLRSILVIAGAEAVRGLAKEVINIACAIEMIHTFSLIHDDLPAMDDDNLRRGRPTNHKVYGEATAILAGDGLLAEAFYLLTKDVSDKNYRTALSIVNDIAVATGARGMTGGQQIDMEYTGDSVTARCGTEENLTKLHNMKTGALITVSATSGAKFCGATREELDALKIYGESIGLAFQIADDILDIEGKEEEIGKDVGSDLENNKATYPAILGLKRSKEREASLVDKAITALAIFDEKADPLKEIARYVVERRS